MDRLIHTPEGVRDVYNQECTKKLYLENQIEQVFHAFGYQDIETPTFEFFDVFGREVGTTPVSYTHLDVYKRQPLTLPPQNGRQSNWRVPSSSLILQSSRYPRGSRKGLLWNNR